jgi:hypothetical protein
MSRLGSAGPRLAAILLGAACVVWAGTPVRHSGWAQFALVVSVVAVTAGALRLALSDIPQPGDTYFVSGPVRTWLGFLALLRGLPWEEIGVATVLWVEVLHAARPWHTAALGAGLVAYLLAVHIAESGAPDLPRRQAKVLLAGACLLALAAGAAMLPGVGAGAGSALLRLLAAVAVIAAAVLALPA